MTEGQEVLHSKCAQLVATPASDDDFDVSKFVPLLVPAKNLIDSME